MSTLTNHVSNPGGELSPAGWYNSPILPGTLVQDLTMAPQLIGTTGKAVLRWDSAGGAAQPGRWQAFAAPGDAPVVPGQWVRSGLRTWTDDNIKARAGVTFLDADRKAVAYMIGGTGTAHPAPAGGALTTLVQAPDQAAYARARVEYTPDTPWAEGDAKRIWMDGAYLYVGDTPDELPAVYFDGAMPTAGAHSYGWSGKPYNSTSYRLDTIDLVHPWTRTWWDALPHAYKEADEAMNPELGGYPLLRWMNGVGQLAGEMRQLSDDLWAGKFTNPATAPNSALRWLAMMLGLSSQHRQQPDDVLRERLLTLTNVGRSSAGTRAMIAESAKAFLIPGAQARVEPSSTRPHVLIMYVRAYEVPDDNLPGLAAKVNAAGFVPAGHIVECKPVISTWDSWEDAAGETWAEKEENIKTWNESDSAGVVLE